MARRQGTSQGPSIQDQGASSFPKPGSNILGLATLFGVVAVLLISLSNWREMGQFQTRIDTRLDEIESKIGQGSKAAAPQPARRGPDPNRVYSINTAGSPSKGPPGAAVTIAEFSDFQ